MRTHIALVTLFMAGTATAQDRRTLSGDAAVYDLAGTVRVVAGAGRDVTVETTLRGRDAGKLRVQQSEVRGRQAVHVAFPDDDIVYPALGRSRVSLRARADGTFGDAGGGGFFSGRQMTIRGSGRGTEAWADMTVAVPAGRSLHVHVAAGDANVSNVDGDLVIDADGASVTTERTRGRLTIDAGSGRVHVVGAQGDVNLDLGSGAAELRDVNASRLRVDGGSGDVTAANVTAPDVTLDIGSGDARLSGVSTRQLRLDSGSGAVDLELVSDVDDVRIDTGSGSLTLRIPPTLGARLDVDTGSGGIETEVPVTVTRREHDHLTGSIGDGRGRIVIDGGSGKVRLVKTDARR